MREFVVWYYTRRKRVQEVLTSLRGMLAGRSGVVFFFFFVCMCVCAFDTLSQEFGLGTVTFPVATFLRKKRLTRAETSLLFWQQRRVHEGSKFNVTPFSVSFFLHSLFSFLPLFFFPLSSLLPVHTCAFHCFSRCVGNCSLSRNLKRK